MHGQTLRAAAAKLRAQYAKHFDVPIESVEVVYWRNVDESEDAAVRAPGFPDWEVGL